MLALPGPALRCGALQGRRRCRADRAAPCAPLGKLAAQPRAAHLHQVAQPVHRLGARRRAASPAPSTWRLDGAHMLLRALRAPAEIGLRPEGETAAGPARTAPRPTSERDDQDIDDAHASLRVMGSDPSRALGVPSRISLRSHWAFFYLALTRVAAFTMRHHAASKLLRSPVSSNQRARAEYAPGNPARTAGLRVDRVHPTKNQPFAFGNCYWDGTRPICAGSRRPGFVVRQREGSGW